MSYIAVIVLVACVLHSLIALILTLMRGRNVDVFRKIAYVVGIFLIMNTVAFMVAMAMPNSVIREFFQP